MEYHNNFKLKLWRMLIIGADWNQTLSATLPTKQTLVVEIGVPDSQL